MAYLLPVWIIGAPFLLAIFDWIRTPGVPATPANSTYTAGSTTRAG